MKLEIKIIMTVAFLTFVVGCGTTPFQKQWQSKGGSNPNEKSFIQLTENAVCHTKPANDDSPIKELNPCELAVAKSAINECKHVIERSNRIDVIFGELTEALPLLNIVTLPIGFATNN
jgi:hypothetical protein